MSKLSQPDANLQEPKQRQRKNVEKKNIDPGRPVGRPVAPVAADTGWGKTLTKQELLGLIDRVYAKQEENKMSKMSEKEILKME